MARQVRELTMAGTIWTPVLGWVGAIGAAFALALAAPSESGLVGKLPNFTARRLHDRAPVTLPQELPSERTLAVVMFKKSQSDEAQAWIDGLRLQGSPVSWLRLPVFNDPGDESKRRTKEAFLLARYPSEDERSRLVPVFTNKEAFVRATGLTDDEHVSVLVLDRTGNVLAKAQGPYDEAKAQAFRETIASLNN